MVFGGIALCAFLFDAAAVRLWFMKHRLGAGLIGFIAAAALIVTFSNSLGGIVSRTDAVMAQRQSAADSRADNRRELLRLEKALADLGKFTPADEEAVKAAKRAADTATSNKAAECDKRGPNCRQRELDEAAAATNLATVAAAKTATDRARKLEADIAAIKLKLAQPGNDAGGCRQSPRYCTGEPDRVCRRCAHVLAAGYRGAGVRIVPGRRDGHLRASGSLEAAGGSTARECEVRRCRARRPHSSTVAQELIEADRSRARFSEGHRGKCFALHYRARLNSP